MDLANPRIAQLDLAYHDIRRGRGLFDLLQRKSLVDRVTDDGEIEAAKDTPPQTTRAKLRGDFIAAAQAAGRDFTVDWVHLKLNDQAQRTVLCQGPVPLGRRARRSAHRVALGLGRALFTAPVRPPSGGGGVLSAPVGHRTRFLRRNC